MAFNSLNDSGLADHMASLECSIELLLDQVSEILRKLSFVELVLILSPSCVLPPIVASLLNLALNLDMTVNSVVVPSFFSPPVVRNATPELSLSSSKVLTTKVGGLKLKIMALEVSVGLVLARLDFLCSSLRINNPAKQDDIICWHKKMNNLISIVTETKLKDKIYP
ncbi:hypothetical protein G9A89_021305 [Geosiphon pyriformis]|nr:hypothetical protein G9A89_021305 [Geosiphon pyriformis]